MGDDGAERVGRMRLRRSLVAGAFVLLGIACSAVFLADEIQVRRAIGSAAQLAHHADRSTYLVGEVAHRVDDISATLDQQPGEPTEASFRAVNADLVRLDAAMRDLPHFLDEEDASTFAVVRPRIDAFNAAVARVLAASGTRYTPESRRVFQQELLPVVASLEAPLDHLIDLNAAQAERLLAKLDRDLAAFRRWQLTAGAAFVAFLTAVAAGTLRLLDRQHRAIERQLAAIEQTNRDLDAFAGRVAHDLRGPLTPITLGAARLWSVTDRPDAVREIAGRINAPPLPTSSWSATWRRCGWRSIHRCSSRFSPTW